MNQTGNFAKINKSLEKGRYFSTIWCTLDTNIIPYLKQVLEPLLLYCKWLSTFGDNEKNGKFLPHITLRYLGFTDELDKEKIKEDKELFSKVIENIKIKEVLLGKINVWEQTVDGNVVVARLGWEILDLDALKIIHNNLLQVPGYQFFENLEGEKFNPHISLGEINLEGDNLEKVKEYLEKQNFVEQKVGLQGFAINIAEESGRDEIAL